MTAVVTTAKRGSQVIRAFLRLGYRDTMSYPLALVMKEIAALVPVFTFFFIAKLFDNNGPEVGGDYYTFVMIGVVALRTLGSGLQGLSQQLNRAVGQGQLEMLLVAPVPWRALPFVMIQWEILLLLGTGVIAIGASWILGASYVWSAVPIAVLITLLGLTASLGIGIIDASVLILSKRANPVLTIYSVAATVLSGSFYPIEVLPGPLQALAWAIPHTYVIQALRRVLMPGGETIAGPSAGQSILGLVVLCVVLYPVGLWLYGRALEYGRKMGLLAGY